ncbi:hypothetical protein [Paradevosia shaoguanensis]|uniref:hypothetical protein n=1 Tax=Paradevosia shaoguanensis TaxID=1335043 RepID=UPI003C77E230
MLGQLSSARLAPYYLAGVIFAYYGLVPAVVQAVWGIDAYYWKLATVATTAAVSIVAGFHIPVFDRLVGGVRPIVLPARVAAFGVWGAFVVLVFVILATADNIPFLNALSGASTAQDLIVQRQDFLAARQGWEAALPYLNVMFMGSIIPYALAVMFVNMHRLRWIALPLVMAYSLLALEKILLVKVLTPLFILAMQRRVWNAAILVLMSVLTLGLFYLTTYLSRGETSSEEMAFAEAMSHASPAAQAASGFSVATYFSTDYRPSGAIDLLIWRSIAVPIFTAADALKVIDTELDNQLQFGATSTFLAPLAKIVTGRDKINFDAMVYTYQWGSHLGRANSAYFNEASVNFGWPGVVGFSLIIGLCLRLFSRSPDPAFAALWPLFCWNVFQAGLIGTLLSNGFLLVFAFMLFVRLEETAAEPSPRVRRQS